MQQGLKYDKDKLRWDLLPIECVEEIVKVLTMGAAKYAPNNWQLVEDGTNRYYAALLRHLSQWRQGELVDSESGLSHLSHVLCNVTFLLWLDKEKERKEQITNQENVNITSPTNAPHLKATTTAAPFVGNEFTNVS